ncbi:MAG: tRNA adenosine(34) deaminase TadA [bacterium]|nr:tRNA adenosine(34) deaminase TadA [bacterium]
MVADEAGMRLALREAQAAARADEVPVGAVILKDGEVVGRGRNRILETGDPTAHAEMLAIQSATHWLGERWLSGCTLFVTLEPCAMCAGALVLARIHRLVFGASDPKTGACGSLRNVVEDGRLNHQVGVQRGVLAGESSQLLKQFFGVKRR